MNKSRAKTLIWMALVSAVTFFLAYIYFRIKIASGLPVIHTLWNAELASLLRTIARSVQLLGILAASLSIASAVQRFKAKEPFVFVRVLQAGALAAICFVTPDVAKWCIPVVFGTTF